jgi:multisubunit Na+/H+ antiporter MnhC subunit
MYRFADVYGSGTYGDGTYACNTQTNTGTGCAAGASTGGSSTPTNPLANTGVLVALIVGAAAFLLMIVVLVRFWRRPSAASAKTAQKPEIATIDTQAK